MALEDGVVVFRMGADEDDDEIEVDDEIEEEEEKDDVDDIDEKDEEGIVENEEESC